MARGLENRVASLPEEQRTQAEDHRRGAVAPHGEVADAEDDGGHEVRKLVDGVFYASLICERDKAEEIIDARTSDAIALALRFSAPIFTYKNILEKAGIILKTDSKKDDDKGHPEDVLLFDDLEIETEEVETSNDGYQPKSIKELQELLTKAVADEDYETAAKIRDEISKR